MRTLRTLGLTFVLLLAARWVAAHPVPFSYLDLHVQAGAIDATLVVHIIDAAHDLHLEPPERLLQPSEASGAFGPLTRLLGDRFTVSADGRPLTPTWLGIDPIPDRQSVRMRLRFPVASPPGTVTVDARMFPYDPAHQTFLNVYEGEALTQSILDGAHPEFEYFAGTRQGAAAVIRKFVPAGIHHILIGPDHLLFLVGLLLLGGTIRQLALVVTSFTVAHSITLSLAALNLVS
ncbi:MAG TPA: HupE/UreJ family protein, partial [Vicinamibacterales bacterium]|nr:HupE/UreJ family protein [Vicinamibacterales bacterium]